MKTMKFKTNINCESCVKAVTPALKSNKKIYSWNVDTQNPNKILTVQGDIDAAEVASIITSIGYKAEETKE